MLNSAYVTKVIMVVVTFVYFIFRITGYMRFPYWPASSDKMSPSKLSCTCFESNSFRVKCILYLGKDVFSLAVLNQPRKMKKKYLKPLMVHSHLKFSRCELLQNRNFSVHKITKTLLHNPLLNFWVNTKVNQIASVNASTKYSTTHYLANAL